MNLSHPKFGEADLDNCAREPIQIPGSIQPHGVLLAVDPATLNVVQAGGETEKLLGLPLADLIGQSLRRQLEPAALQRLESLQMRGQILPRPFFVFQTAFGRTPFDVTAHLSGGLLLLELEPQLDVASDGIEVVQSMLSRLEPHTTLDGLLDAMASEVRAVTGYDRVMVYRFLGDDSGHVVAESRRDETIDSFLDLHYPASDIPAQARDLYRRNWMRCIPDARYAPLALTPQNNPKTGAPLDLSFSALRSVSPLHLEYLANMGVRSSMSLSIVIGDRLWGLIACHAAKPVYLDSRLRGALELFAQLSSLQLRSQIELKHSDEEVRVRNTLNALIHAMSRDDLQTALTGARPNLLDFIPAAGVTVRFEGVNFSLGRVPGDDHIDRLIAWLDSNMAEGTYSTHQLVRVYPPAAAFIGSGAGLLALSVSRSPRDYVLWFLPEHATAVTWAGNPEKPVEVTDTGSRLSPRKSFEAWSEMVEGQARPWRPIEIEAANLLRVSILEIVIQRTDQIAKERTKAQDQQNLLMAELDHRVKNTLATIQAVVRFSSKSAEDLETFTATIERRLHAMANAHSLLTNSRWEGLPLRQIIHEELAAFEAYAEGRITLDGEDKLLDPRASLSLAMAIHELTTNAVKYGSLSVSGGLLAIAWREEGNFLRLAWAESNGPPVVKPVRRGFGRTLLESVFAHDVDGKVTLDFAPAGFLCHLEISRRHVLEGVPVRRVPPPDRGRHALDAGMPLRGLKVLVVEDNTLTAMELSDSLVASGAAVYGPYSRLGTAAAVAAEGPFDIALLDIDLQGQAIWPIASMIAARNLPIVFLTAYSQKLMRPALFTETPTVLKPYDYDTLLQTIARAAGLSDA